MAMKFFSLHDDNYHPDRWFLGDITVPDNWIFTYGRAVNAGEMPPLLSVAFDKKGVALDFTKTDAYGVPIISENLADVLFEFGDFIQLFPVSIPDTYSNYYILVVKYKIDCVDEGESDFEKFEAGNNIRPDKVGAYEAINRLVVHVSKIDKPIFRIDKYEIEIVVSEEVKIKLERANLTGLKFDLVS